MDDFSPPNSSIHFPKTIKQLVKDSELLESRDMGMWIQDLYRLEDSASETGALWFTVKRGSYERIKWLSHREAGDFIANTIIDEILRKGGEDNGTSNLDSKP